MLRWQLFNIKNFPSSTQTREPLHGLKEQLGPPLFSMKKHHHLSHLLFRLNHSLERHRQAAFTIWQYSQALSWEFSEASAVPMPWMSLHSLMWPSTCHRTISSRLLTWLSHLPGARFSYTSYTQTTHTNPVFLLWTYLPMPKLGSVEQEYLPQPISFSTSCCLFFLPFFPVHVLINSLLQCQENFIFVNLLQTSKKLKTRH